MSSKRIAGTCYFKVNGNQLETTVDGEVDVSLLTVKRETLKPGFYKETEQNPRMTGTFLFTKDFPMQTLEVQDDMTITVELANGKVATLQEAYVVDETTVKNADGTIELTFEGRRVIWS